MKDEPFVSIIIASLNGRRYLEDCILSIKEMDYPQDKLEIILVDDASKDGSTEHIRDAFRDIKIIRNRRNRGVSVSRNIGIKNSRGKLLAFLDNDVRVERRWLSELVRTMSGDDKTGICAPKLLFENQPNIINSAGGVMNIYAHAWDRGIFEEDRGQYDTEERVFFGCSAAMLARRDVLEKAGYFDPALYLYEDVDLGWRVNLLGYKIIYAPASVAYHRFGGTIQRDTLRSKYLLERNRMRIIFKNYEVRTLLRNSLGLLKFKASRFEVCARFAPQDKIALLASALAAWGWNTLNVLDTLKRRAAIQKKKIASDKDILELLGAYKHENYNL